MRVLIVEDEPKMASLLHRGLGGEGMAVDVAHRGEDALWRAEATSRTASPAWTAAPTTTWPSPSPSPSCSPACARSLVAGARSARRS